MRAPAKTERSSENSSEKSESKKLTFKEKLELETLEMEIPETEKRLAEIEHELSRFAADAFKVNELFIEQQKLNFQLETDTERWLELSERAG